ncbi:helix-turn-helix domain-containing protein [Roseburia sp. 831b]|uniref:helix-turn-helix domain-containing protein n=1 Tax=Roseburia sp. 831b TaxID=1261635 RepID=UPI000952A1F2|nr:helix-turn-helix transcriptional regulator [Roseburia sp. 831b]MDY4840548.1 helix-turn-helix transcriptional regulator [Lachnospiraceae bacterium]WVK74161.1 helix-turn-helix transcriptional regulator [Roseburia sp. 831b]
MAISYNNLWKLLIDKGLNKGDLRKMTGISSSTVAKMTNGEAVTLTVIEKICDKLDCKVEDVVEIKSTTIEKNRNEETK